MSMKRLLPQYRGVRLRPYMRHLDKFLVGGLFLLGAIPLAYYGYQIKEKLMAVDIQSIAILFGLFLSVLFLSLYLSWLLVERTVLFAKMDRLKRLARFLYENNYVYEKKGQGQNKKRKVKFPKIYLKQNKFDLEASFELAGSKFQEKFKKIGGDLETTFSMDFMETEDDNRFKTYRLAYSSLLNRLKGNAMKYSRGKGVELMKNFFWDFESDPHMLVVGGTGGGKTVLLRFLILCLSKIGVVYVCDPKRADFVTLAELPAFKGRVAFDVESILESVEHVKRVMEERYDFMRSERERLGQKDLLPYYEYGLEPVFWVCDELNAFKSMLDWKQTERFDSALGQIVLLGRQAGVNAIVAMQKPSREDLGSKLQANINFRVAVGRLDEMGYDLAFEEVNRNKEFKFMKYVGGVRVFGRGYASVKGQVAREFYSPLLTKGFLFFDEFSKIERREHKHRLVEAVEESEKVSLPVPKSDEVEEIGEIAMKEQVYDVNDVVELLGKSYGQVTNLVGLIEENNIRTFDKEDGKIRYSFSDVELLQKVFERKDTSKKTYQEVLEEIAQEMLI